LALVDDCRGEVNAGSQDEHREPSASGSSHQLGSQGAAQNTRNRSLRDTEFNSGLALNFKALTRVLERAKVAPAWSGATSAWLLKWPAELKAHSPIEIDTSLQRIQIF